MAMILILVYFFSVLLVQSSNDKKNSPCVFNQFFFLAAVIILNSFWLLRTNNFGFQFLFFIFSKSVSIEYQLEIYSNQLKGWFGNLLKTMGNGEETHIGYTSTNISKSSLKSADDSLKINNTASQKNKPRWPQLKTRSIPPKS